MKKILSCILLILIVFSFTGCSNSDKSIIKDIKRETAKMQEFYEKITYSTDDRAIDIYTEGMRLSLYSISSDFNKLSDKGKDKISTYLESNISKETMDYALDNIGDSDPLNKEISDDIKNLSYQ